jgi:hypothetical protein
MARRRYNNPKPQTTMHLFVEACEYLDGHKISRTEPKHEVLDRIISEHEQQKQLIDDLEWTEKDLKQSLYDSKEIRAKLEQQLQAQIGIEKAPSQYVLRSQNLGV